MTPLKRRALARLPMTEAEVSRLWAAYCGGEAESSRRIEMLCESHERLRAELAGATAMLESAERKAAHGCTDATCTECDR